MLRWAALGSQIAVASLHRLLWGAGEGGEHLDDWPMRPWEMPAIGLPVRVATRLYYLAREAKRPDAWNADRGPTTWLIRDTNDGVLAHGRRGQLGHDCGSVGGQRVTRDDVQVRQVADREVPLEVPPHAAYYVPYCACSPVKDICDESYALYCDTLLLLTALDGGEGVLDSIVNRGGGIVPFQDRWAWRARLHLPEKAWPCIERIVRWAENPDKNCGTAGRCLLDALQDSMAQKITESEFGPERIDIQLYPGDREVVRTVRLFEADNVFPPEQLKLSQSSLCEKLCVRIGQVNQWATGTRMKEIVDQFPRWESGQIREVMRQVAAVFRPPNESRTSQQAGLEGHSPELVVLPEVAIPQSEVRTVRDLVADTGCASLAGLYWRELPPVYRGKASAVAMRRWIVNEAEVAIPIGFNERGPTTVRWFRVRKPFPAHIEKGMVKALEKNGAGTRWSILEGRRWYRFVHGTWGDFTVAVCADLLDPEPWRSLRGEVLHLFMVAFNRDVDLYESLTWTRTYETYSNVVAVNHGIYGGSFLWTPQRRRGRELASLRGTELFLTADVELPVKDLLREQQEGVVEAVRRAACESSTDSPSRGRYKAPPPGYRRRALTE